jgi:hypothetical protein
MKRYVIFLTGFLIASACFHSPSTDKDVQQHDQATRDCTNMCAHLRTLCSDTNEPRCVATCIHVQMTRLIDMNFDCINAAETSTDVRACEVVNCKDMVDSGRD